MSIKENIERIKSEVCSSNAKIIAVSKYVSIEKMKEAYEAGLRDFAESKVNDALEKINQLPEDMKKNIKWHFIGHLQTNKVKKVVGHFDLIHSVDSYKLASNISAFAAKENLVQPILLQVNIANEEQKFGFSPQELRELFAQIIKLENIKVEGLMMMAPLSDDENLLSELFEGMSKLKLELCTNSGYAMSELSMGMSNDYLLAAQKGSTMIRVGSKIFNS